MRHIIFTLRIGCKKQNASHELTQLTTLLFCALFALIPREKPRRFQLEYSAQDPLFATTFYSRELSKVFLAEAKGETLICIFLPYSTQCASFHFAQKQQAWSLLKIRTTTWIYLEISLHFFASGEGGIFFSFKTCIIVSACKPSITRILVKVSSVLKC